MNKRIGTNLLLAAILAGSAAVTAETIEIPVGQQAQEKWSLDRPVKGMNKQQVEALFGRPQVWNDPTGDPPISSWVYNEFVVYFEYEHVIHTVLKHLSSEAQTQ
ncbi:hypothetical protein FKG94_09630 [Exilibacterium tricleocarpae]|uniref:Outer membrane protein assembly factor BamE n=1 Tax=Exilibacterium tricleocarpae TaxID=2591008 RepID=A0A545TW05_9GAMM|nr:hypothetical protein [Exilibacterium tricleocarpae]TQV81341.1 hypothetical protein FKG94_09630 [Exilibacterium tricleocarpae]